LLPPSGGSRRLGWGCRPVGAAAKTRHLDFSGSEFGVCPIDGALIKNRQEGGFLVELKYG